MTTYAPSDLSDVWMQTYTGKRFYILQPERLEVDLHDIAHHLSNESRFGGATYDFYSVAQHSVAVSLICRSEHAALGLLHDATEAYLKDIPYPLKQVLRPIYGDLESRLAKRIGDHFGLDLVALPLDVHEADRIMLATEKRDLLRPVQEGGPAWDPRGLLQPFSTTLVPVEPRQAEYAFLERATRLGLL